MRPAGKITPARSLRAANLAQHRELLPSRIASCLMWLDSSGLADGALASWPDKSAAGNDAAQGTGSLQPNVVGGVVDFDGTDDYLAVTDAAFALDEVSLFAVVQSGGTAASDRMILGQDDLSYALTFHNADKVYAYIDSGSNGASYSIPLDDGAKHSLALTFDGTTGTDSIKLYHNGVQVATRTSNTAVSNAGNTVQIGGQGVGNDFLEQMYHAAVFSSCLRADQVAALHRALI